MKIEEFRGDELINRSNEIEFFKDYFKNVPQRILWVYGPKSSGKTTLIEYVIERVLMRDFGLFKASDYWVKYINFRGLLVTNYDNFISSFFEEVEDDEIDDFSEGEIEGEINLGVIRIKSKLFNQLSQNKKNLFNQLILNLQKIKKKKIIIIDEIQTLQDIYLNGERLLLNEFLNFCVRLTKELHTSHAVILTSNTVFLERIYNNSRLKKTTNFKLINHLEKKDIAAWLGQKGFNKEEIDLIYDYLGGCVSDIKKLLDEYRYYDTLKEYLDLEADRTKNEIEIFIAEKKLSDNFIDKFKFIANEIIETGYFYPKNLKDYIDIIFLLSENEILFFDPVNNIVSPSSRIYVKAFKRLME